VPRREERQIDGSALGVGTRPGAQWRTSRQSDVAGVAIDSELTTAHTERRSAAFGRPRTKSLTPFLDLPLTESVDSVDADPSLLTRLVDAASAAY
jgi:hypothetical protein